MAYRERADLPDPELVLADPDGFPVPDRGDQVHALLEAVLEAVRRDRTRARWEVAWSVLARLAGEVPADLLAGCASGLAGLRVDAWPPPASLDRLGPLQDVLGWSA
jgi:hypothetical protein